MTLTIGRFEIDECPYDITHDGDRLSFSFDIDGSTTGGDHDVAKVYRQQLLGLVDNDDEPVVPITWTDDPDWDGFYRIARVELVPTPVYLVDSSTVRHFSVMVEAERVGGGYAQPLVEIPYVTASLSTSVSAVTPSYVFAVPNTALQSTSGSTRATDTGHVRLLNVSSDPVAFLINPSDFYDGACRVEYLSGGTYHHIVGGQHLVTPAEVRLSNGLVRVSFSGSPLTNIDVEVFDGSSWDAVGTFNVSATGTGNWSMVGGVAILRNTSNACVIECYADPISTPLERSERIQLRLQRGALHVECRILTSIGGPEELFVSASSTTASTSITGGIRQTSNGTAGHRWVLASPENFSSNTTTGVIYSPLSADAFMFAIGVELNGSSATSTNTATAVVSQYWGQVYGVETVVSR